MQQSGIWITDFLITIKLLIASIIVVLTAVRFSPLQNVSANLHSRKSLGSLTAYNGDSMRRLIMLDKLHGKISWSHENEGGGSSHTAGTFYSMFWILDIEIQGSETDNEKILRLWLKLLDCWKM